MCCSLLCLVRCVICVVSVFDYLFRVCYIVLCFCLLRFVVCCSFCVCSLFVLVDPRCLVFVVGLCFCYLVMRVSVLVALYLSV